ncbi:MAG: ABC transporter ATP-binding protein [Bacillota bacterium]
MRGGPMGRGGHMGHNFEKPKDFKTTFKKLLNYLSPYKFKLLVVILFSSGSAVFAILAPKLLGNATTKIFEGSMGSLAGREGMGIDFISIKNIIFVLIGLYLGSTVFNLVQGFIVSGVAQRVSYNLRKEMAEKVNRLPLKFFDTTTHGDILSRVTNDIDTVSQTLNQSMSQIISSATTLVGVLVMMLTISWQMTLAALLIMPLSLALIMFIVKRSQKYFKAQQASLGKVNGHVEEIFGGHLVVKAFNAEQEAKVTFDEANDELYQAGWKSQFISGMMMPFMNFIGNLGYVAVSILGGWFTIKKVIQVGDILAFIQYMRNFTQPIAQVAQISNILQSTVAAAERVFEFLEEREKKPEIESAIDLEAIQGGIEFKNVKFGYKKDTTVINNFSSRIQPGQKVAIVGPTGAGKTTIVKLLMNFYDLDGGSILIDGHDLKDFTKKDLRNLFGMVLQDTWLFNGTILENIKYGKLNASDEEVVKAAKAAHVHRFIRTLPDGYKMVVNEEASNLSQGEKQLLTIARAILRDPKILILDEATSSVDTRTEVLIQKAMENLLKGRTAFIIAHRLSTIRDADSILVMRDGDIVEQGNHKELLRRNGFYASLYNSQFERAEAI